MTVTATLRTTGLDQLLAQLPRRSRQVVDDTAAAIRDRASAIAPRDTGSLAASIYLNNGDASDYPQRAGDARSRNRDVTILEDIDPASVISLSGAAGGGYTVVVGVAAGHGIFQELGTRFQSAQPFMTPAVEPSRDAFVEAMSHTADV